MLLMHSLMLYISALPNLTPCGFRVPSLWGNAGYNGNQHWGGWEDACREDACREDACREDACREGGEAGAGRTHAGRGERWEWGGHMQGGGRGRTPLRVKLLKKIPHKTLNSKAFYKCCS